MKASILLVNYNSGPSLLESLRSLHDQSARVDSEIIVWDNASTDGSGELVARSGLPVRVVQSNENLGYAGGMAGAAATAKGNVFVLMNPDAAPKPGALEKLIEAAENMPDQALFGGVVLRDNGSIDPNCHRALPSLHDIQREAWFRKPKGEIANLQLLLDQHQQPIRVPAVSGAVMAIGRNAWNRLGPLDDDFFLYHEDTEWCRRAHEKGMTVAVVPGAVFAHRGGASTGRSEGPAFEARLLSDFRYHCVLGDESPDHVARLWTKRLTTQHRLARLNAVAGIRGSRDRSRRRASIYWLLRDALSRTSPHEIARGVTGTRPGSLVEWPPPYSPLALPRVALIIPDMELGGAQKLIEKTLLETHGEFEYLVICLKRDGSLFEPLRESGHAIRTIGMTDWKSVRSWTRARHYLSLVDADLFHSHLIPSDIAMWRAPRSKRPWISTKHSVDARFGRPERLLEKWALSSSDTIYAVSHTVARAKAHLSKNGSLPTVLINPPSVPMVETDANNDKIGARPLPFSDSTRVRVLSIGRLHPVKKTERFVETAALLRDRDPRRYEFRIVGGGPEEPMLRQKAKAHGLDDALSFHPFTDDVAAAIDWADCVLFFSEGEGLGIVILDTIARGRVPIVRKAGGTVEALPASLSECFVDEDSPEMFADRVEQFARDPEPIHAKLALAVEELRARKAYSNILADQYRKWIAPRDGEVARTRVLHIITRMIIGGAQENTLASVAFVDPARFDSDLWTGPQTGSEGDLRDRAERIGVLPIYFRNVVRELSPVRDLIATWQLYRMLRKRRYDIVHMHTSKIGILGRIAAKMASVPHIIHTAHGWGFHEYMAGWLRRFYITLEKFVLPFTNQLVSVSDETTRVGLEAGIGNPDNYMLIRSGIPTDTFFADKKLGAATRAALGIEPDRIVIGTVGRLSPQKNPLDFVRIAETICAKHERVHFLSVGEGPLRPRVENAIRKAGLEDRVTLLGLRTDVPNLMRTMDLYIMTSLWEGLPRVVVQALATGVPVISYDVAGTKEIVREGKNGFLVPSGDWQALAERIDRVLKDDALRDDLLRTCANEFDTSFTEKKMIADLEELYEGLMKK